MPQAKTLTPQQLSIALAFNERTGREEFRMRNLAMVAVSHFAGLRAQEIARLHLEDITDVQGRLCDVLHVTKRAAKYGRERRLPISARLKQVLRAHIDHYEILRGPLFRNRFGDEMSSGAVQKFFTRLYRGAGFVGATSHSGRRTFITDLARLAGRSGCSIRDVQELAGHAYVDTTQVYVDPSDAQGSLISLHVDRMLEAVNDEPGV